MPEIVIRHHRHGYGFTLPQGHEFVVLDELDEDSRRPVGRIGIPSVGSEAVVVTDIETRGDEIEYALTPYGVSTSVGNEEPGYPWPAPQDVHAALKARWVAAGGEEAAFEAWGHDDWESEFRQKREEIRRLEAGE